MTTCRPRVTTFASSRSAPSVTTFSARVTTAPTSPPQVRISPDEQRIISVGTEGGIFIWRVPHEFATPPAA